MNFVYIFAGIGIITTTVAAILGVAITLTMARFTYVRFKLVAPLFFSPVDGMGQPRGPSVEGLDPSRYAEKTRVHAGIK
jgi:hypothetical protein